MAYVKKGDSVIIDELNFQKFMEYRENKGLATSWEWMTLPAGALLEVTDLVFRTTGARRKKKSDGDKPRRRARSCWVKCCVVTPITYTGQEHLIPSWLLKGVVVSHITPEE